MAPKVTSARDRSKGKAKTPVTSTKGRGNRQSVSQANVTQGGTRGSGTARVTNAAQRSNTGSARVTGSTRPQLPPGRQGGALATRSSGGSPASTRVQPVNVREVQPTRPNLPGRRPALPPAASRVPGWLRGAAGVGGTLMSGVTGGIALAQGLSELRQMNDRRREAAAGPRGLRQTSAQEGSRFTRLQQAQPAANAESLLDKAKRERQTRQTPAARQPASNNNSGGRLPYRPSGSPYVPRAAVQPAPSAPGPVKAKPSNYGPDGKSLYNADKKDNPLMQRTFGYQTGNAPDQQAARNNAAQQLKSTGFDTTSNLSPSPNPQTQYTLPDSVKGLGKGAREYNNKKRRSPYAQ